jgi:MFS family permease
MDSVIYALVLSPLLTELLPKSGIKATPGNMGFAGSVLFALFPGGLGLSMIWGAIADRFGRTRVLTADRQRTPVTCAMSLFRSVAARFTPG